MLEVGRSLSCPIAYICRACCIEGATYRAWLWIVFAACDSTTVLCLPGVLIHDELQGRREASFNTTVRLTLLQAISCCHPVARVSGRCLYQHPVLHCAPNRVQLLYDIDRILFYS